jgi:hypothetical protein
MAATSTGGIPTTGASKGAARELVAIGAGVLQLVGRAIDDDLHDAQERLLGRRRGLRRARLVRRFERRMVREPDREQNARREHDADGRLRMRMRTGVPRGSFTNRVSR